jgi:L-ascorbate metabolism protein UlaG (beta-lactamase superfamily)
VTATHFDGKRFFNPTRANGQPASAVPRMLSEPRKPWPSNIAVSPVRPPALGDSAAVITFVGHATFLIQTPKGNVIIDPMFSERASPLSFVGPRRVRAPAVRFDDLPPIALVLLSHNHYDHCDAHSLRAIATRWNPLVVTPIGNGRLLRSFGLQHVEELDWWQRSTRSIIPVSLTRAQHFSARTPFDRNRALWGGFAIDVGGRQIFHAGDTGYGPHFELVREKVGAIDLALLPIGAYEPRWFMRDIHMNPEDAVRAHVDLRAVRSIGMHFGTFHLTAEGVDDPIVALANARRAHAIADHAFVAPQFGESFRID